MNGTSLRKKLVAFSKRPNLDVVIRFEYASEITTNIESICNNINTSNTTDVITI